MSATQLGFGFGDGAMSVPEVEPRASRKSVDDDSLRKLASFRDEVRRHREYGAFSSVPGDLRMLPWIGDSVFLQLFPVPGDPSDFRLRPMMLPEPSLSTRESKRGVRMHHDERTHNALRDMGVRSFGTLNDFGYLVQGLGRSAPNLSRVRVYSICVTNLPDGRRRPVRPAIRAEDCKSARRLMSRVGSRMRGCVVLAHVDALRDVYQIDHDRGMSAMVDAPTLALVEEVLGRDSTRVPF